MKKIILTMVTLLLASSAVFAQRQDFGQDAVAIANLMKHGAVRNCVEKVEKDNSAQFSITKIVKDEVEDLTKYEITGILLQGGDIAKGYAKLEIEGSMQPFTGWGYTCQIKANLK